MGSAERKEEGAGFSGVAGEAFKREKNINVNIFLILRVRIRMKYE